MPDTELESLSRLIADAAEPLPAIDVRQAARSFPVCPAARSAF